MQEKDLNRKSSKIIKLAQKYWTTIFHFALNFELSFIFFVENEVLTKVTWRNDDLYWKIDLKMQDPGNITRKIIDKTIVKDKLNEFYSLKSTIVNKLKPKTFGWVTVSTDYAFCRVKHSPWKNKKNRETTKWSNCHSRWTKISNSQSKWSNKHKI